MKRIYLLLIGIVLLASILRFYKLGSLPPSLTWDEVAWGYNAYAIGGDLKDEFGKLLPFTYLESFGDYKPPLYAYASILPVKIFGLSEFSTRFASAFFGVATVFIAFFLVLQIFGKEEKNLALLSSLLMAISPWHIMLSRAAFEANVSTFFIVLGVWLFLASTKKIHLFPLSLLSFLASMYTFNSARIVVPLLGIFLVGLFWKKMLENKKIVLVSCLVAALLYLPLFLFLQTPQAKLRFAEVNIFSDSAVVEKANDQIANDNNAAWSKLIHNRRLAYGVSYLHHYFDNLTPNFLFFQGDGNPKFSTQDVGELYLWEIPFLVGGALLLFRRKEKNKWIVPVWLLVGIIPAAFARETPHALRIEATLPTFQIITALGVMAFFRVLSVKKIKPLFFKSIAFIFAIVVFLNFSYFLHGYVKHYSTEFSGEWQFGYKESIAYVDSVKSHYKTIYITEELGRPYIYYLFYTQYPPAEFRKKAEVFREVYGFVHVLGYENYRFVKDFKQAYQDKENTMFVSSPNDIPDSATTLKSFYLLNGKEVLRAYTL